MAKKKQARDPYAPRHVPCGIEEYHARDEISNSQISAYLDPERGPLYYHGMHYCKPPLWPREHKQAWDFGQVVHQMLGAPGMIHEVAVEIPPDALNSQGHRKGKAWTEFQAEHEEKILLTPAEMAKARSMIRRVYDHPVAGRLLSNVLHIEHSHVWRDQETDLDCRTRCDFACGWNGQILLVDLKSSRAIKPSKFAYAVRDYGYHRQAAFYSEPWRLLGYEVAAFAFLAVGKDPPYPVRVYELDDRSIEVGRDEIRGALASIRARMDDHGNRPMHDDTCWHADHDVESMVLSLPESEFQTEEENA